MRGIEEAWLAFARNQFPKGSVVKIWDLDEPLHTDITGTLDHIDDQGCFHARLEDGSIRILKVGAEQFSIQPPAPTLLKLYMPLTADFRPRDEWGCPGEDEEVWGGRTLLDYEGQILGALAQNRMSEEKERGLMHWYGERDSLDAKVRSAEFTVEARDGQLWGVAACQVAGALSAQELDTLKDYLGGQASDGWGEGFEQQDIRVDGGDLNVHLWSSDHGWSIQTEAERFAPKIAGGLPEMCYSTLQTTGQLICIRRGERGYSPTEWDTGDAERNAEEADRLNERLGVTPAQRMAMEIGSMAGWEVPGADPKNVEIQKKEQIEGMTFG